MLRGERSHSHLRGCTLNSMGVNTMQTKFLAVAAIAISSTMISGCATTEAVKQAQATADQALALAKQGNAAADKAQATADAGVNAAQRAQVTADAAGAAAAVADGKAEAAGAKADNNDKTFWQHHETHHRHRRP